MGQWISVNDRTPDVKVVKSAYGTWKESDYVLVICKDKRYAIAQYEIDNDGRYWARDDGGGEEVTHWMPLPEPPKRLTQPKTT